MCIIVLKGFGVKMPDDDTLRRCFTRHSDGFGMAFSDNGSVHILKGALTPDAMLTMVKSVSRIDQRSVMMHFRTATHGAVGVANCHPFPISTDDNELGSGDLATKVAVAHNGILHSQLGTGTYVHRDSKLSDSAEFIKKYLPTMRPILKDSIGLEVLAGFVGISNKMAFLYPETSWRINTWYEDIGIFYSNESYKDYKPTYTAAKSTYTPGKTSIFNNDLTSIGFYGPHFYSASNYPFKVCSFCGGILHPTSSARSNAVSEAHYTLNTNIMCCVSCYKKIESVAKLPPKVPTPPITPTVPIGKRQQYIGGHNGYWENRVWQRSDDRELIDFCGNRFMCGD